MKASTLLQSSLLAAGLLLGGMSVAHADGRYSIILRSGDFHRYPYDYHHCKKPGWHTGHPHDRGYHFNHHGKSHRKHHKGYHGHRDQSDWHGHRERWLHGKLDDRNDDGRHGKHSRSAAIGYTGRS